MATTAAVVMGSFSGCLGGDDGPDDVVESYIEEAYELETDDPWDDLDGYFHSYSNNNESADLELVSVETQVTDENLDRSELDTYAGFQLTGNQLDYLVENEETALVEATVRVNEGGEERDLDMRFLLATDEGEWKIVVEL